MGRSPKFSVAEILDAGIDLIACSGPTALTISGIAHELGAPSGSIYHRFPSRDLLAAELWLRSVEAFQDACIPDAVFADPVQAIREIAANVLRWCREETDTAVLLLLYRSSDFFPGDQLSGDRLSGDWPDDLRTRNEAQMARVARLSIELCDRLEATTPAQQRRVRFATVDIPASAARASLANRLPPPEMLDAIVDDAVVAVLSGI